MVSMKETQLFSNSNYTYEIEKLVKKLYQGMIIFFFLTTNRLDYFLPLCDVLFIMSAKTFLPSESTLFLKLPIDI